MVMGHMLTMYLMKGQMSVTLRRWMNLMRR